MYKLKELDLEKIRKELDEERKEVREILEGKISAETAELVKSVLFIVESPNKARTIASFFGKPSIRKIGPLRAYETTTGNYILTILATKGHIFELTLKEEGAYGVLKENNLYVPIFSPIKKCKDCGHQFTDSDKCPKCGSTNIDDAMDRIKALRELAEEVDYILIGTDPDEEGEKIAFDVYNILRPYKEKLFRAEFHEVTKFAILKALEELREVDKNRVKAQLVRRIEDRWIGFALSQRLWAAFKKKTLSAGRVQTPVLGWVIKRFEEYKKNRAYFYALKFDDFEIVFSSDKKIESKTRKVKIIKASETIVEKNPLPPYTTDTMLRDAVMELKLSVDKIMQLAQDLFELSLITYHRTDSIHVSAVGIQIAKDYIGTKFGEEYFKGRGWGPEGTHEAIRPTRPLDTETLIKMLQEGELQISGLTKYHIRLYDLIFRRFIASQMIAVKLKEAKFIAQWENLKTEIEGPIEIISHGWDLVKPIELLKAKEGGFEAKEIKSWIGSKVSLYTQADLIQLMKERGIGRPSTYATIVKKLFDRKYIVEKKQKIIPTKRGIAVYDYLTSKYEKFVSEQLTAKLQKEMDEISEGKKDYMETLTFMGRELVKIWESKETEYISDSIAYAFKRKISIPWDLFEENREKLSRKTLRNIVAEPLTPLSREIYNNLAKFTIDKIKAETVALAIEKDFKIISSDKNLEALKESNKHLKEEAKNKLII